MSDERRRWKSQQARGKPADGLPYEAPLRCQAEREKRPFKKVAYAFSRKSEETRGVPKKLQMVDTAAGESLYQKDQRWPNGAEDQLLKTPAFPESCLDPRESEGSRMSAPFPCELYLLGEGDDPPP